MRAEHMLSYGSAVHGFLHLPITRRKVATAALMTTVTMSALTACTTKHTPYKATYFRLSQGFSTAPPGKFAILAEVPIQGTAVPDERNYLMQPTDLLPAPDGGIVVVSESAAPILTWIARNGDLRPYLTKPYPTYKDGTSPSGAVSAYQDSATSVVIVTDTGELARISGAHATRIGQLPIKGNGDILTARNHTLLIQQENTTYRAPLTSKENNVEPTRVHGTKKDEAVAAISPDGSTSFATDGSSVSSIREDGRRLWTAKVEEDKSITAATADDNGGVWVGDEKGGLFHVEKHGKVIPIAPAGGFARNCLSSGGVPPIGEVYSMLLIGNQLYIADKRCDRITVYGVPQA